MQQFGAERVGSQGNTLGIEQKFPDQAAGVFIQLSALKLNYAALGSLINEVGRYLQDASSNKQDFVITVPIWVTHEEVMRVFAMIGINVAVTSMEQLPSKSHQISLHILD